MNINILIALSLAASALIQATLTLLYYDGLLQLASAALTALMMGLFAALIWRQPFGHHGKTD